MPLYTDSVYAGFTVFSYSTVLDFKVSCHISFKSSTADYFVKGPIVLLKSVSADT